MKPIHDPIEAGARALAKHKSLSWDRMLDGWREEQRKQARVMLEAAAQAIEAEGWTDPDNGHIPPATFDAIFTPLS